MPFILRIEILRYQSSESGPLNLADLVAETSMPLLKKKEHELKRPPSHLSVGEDVFVVRVTGEVVRGYKWVPFPFSTRTRVSL